MKDPEIELLNDLARKYPADADDFIRPLPVSEGYAGDPLTVCSYQPTWQPPCSQSRLGFLNQSRKARGLPLIAAVADNGRVVEFAVWVDPEAAG